MVSPVKIDHQNLHPKKQNIDKTGEFMKKYLQAIKWIFHWKTEIQRHSISHFKAFGMINLQYEITTNAEAMNPNFNDFFWAIRASVMI